MVYQLHIRDCILISATCALSIHPQVLKVGASEFDNPSSIPGQPIPLDRSLVLVPNLDESVFFSQSKSNQEHNFNLLRGNHGLVFPEGGESKASGG
jgi:hypothetical protein